MKLWGIDLGGTKIEGAIVDPAAPGNTTCRLRLPTESAKGYDHVLGQIGRVVEQLEQQSGTCRPAIIGIGTPGITEPTTGLLKNSNTTCLNGRPLRDDLAARLGLQVRLANDANCFALAEATLGAARGRGVVVGLILGTGVGSGVVVRGRLIEGLHGIGGEWGHNPMRGEATPCYCGRSGCVETVFAGPALERFYREQSGVTHSLREIATLAAAGGDGCAVRTLRRLQEKFAEAVAVTINILDPDAFVIGGGVGNLNLLYTKETRALVAQHIFNDGIRTEFLRPVLGDSGGVFGAALLACSH